MSDRKRPVAQWGDNVVLADFGARRRREAASGAPAGGDRAAVSRADGWAASTIKGVLSGRADAGRVARGRDYYREGKVIGVELGTDAVAALVAGSQLEPFEVSLGLRPLSPGDREFVERELLDDSALLRTVLAGQQPPGKVGQVLLSGADLREVRCSCPDSSRVCKHVVAVGYALAETLNATALTLLTWRGIDAHRIMAQARQGGGMYPAGEVGQRTPRGAGGDAQVGGVGGADAAGAEPETVDGADFWGSPGERVRWEPLEFQRGIDQGDRQKLMAALRTVSWTHVDQLAALHELELCYEALEEAEPVFDYSNAWEKSVSATDAIPPDNDSDAMDRSAEAREQAEEGE